LESCLSYKVQHIKIAALCVYYKGFVARKTKLKPKIKLAIIVNFL